MCSFCQEVGFHHKLSLFQIRYLEKQNVFSPVGTLQSELRTKRRVHFHLQVCSLWAILSVEWRYLATLFWYLNLSKVWVGRSRNLLWVGTRQPYLDFQVLRRNPLLKIQEVQVYCVVLLNLADQKKKKRKKERKKPSWSILGYLSLSNLFGCLSLFFFF